MAVRALVLATVLGLAPAAWAEPQRVLIISEDGMRPDALDAASAPAHMALMKAGARARIATTIHESDTLPSHAAMLSGFGAREHKLTWNSWQPKRGYIHVPTVFSVAKQHGVSTAMFVGKSKLRHITPPGTVDHVERPSYLCHGVAKRAGEYLQASRPQLMFVHFSDPDEAGHHYGWMSPQYVKAVAASDRCLATLLGALEASGLAKSTLVIVTADHGGHARVHSDSREEVDRQIPWIVRGPGIVPGAIIDVPIKTQDTAATALAALGLPMPSRIAGLSRLKN